MTEWSPQQIEALREVGKWMKRKNDQVLYLAGYAGTGKTTLSREIAENVGGDVCFAAYTGKAASVMRAKGCKGASTIHSLIYSAVEDEETGLVTYQLNHGSAAADADLIIIDECSMIDQKLANDLLSFGTKILVLGDPFQLPPVSGAGYFTSGEPDIMLTEVHRQAADNPIIHLSMKIRAGERLKVGNYGPCRIITRDNVLQREVAEVDQVIVGRHKTRIAFNHKIRKFKHGAQSNLPVHGEKLICLRNKHMMGLLNGEMWNVHAVTGQEQSVIKMDVVPSDDIASKTPKQVSVHEFFFEGREDEIDPFTRKYFEEFTYGHAITCHKSQGSQWNSTMIFDEGFAFREQANNWRYTAITRSAERCIYVVT